MWDDKRQFTGNIVHNALGQICLWHGIYQGFLLSYLAAHTLIGKTKASWPSESARARPGAENFLYGCTKNHWSNATEKKKLLDRMVEYRSSVIERLIVQGRIPIALQEGARNGDLFPMVVLLDCWPVNLSKEIKDYIHDKYRKFMRVRFIPAGLTGGWQINDSYLHSPLKANLKKEAELWYEEHTSNLLRQFDLGEITIDEVVASTHKMMSRGVLRDNSVAWTVESLKRIEKRDDAGNNVILKGK